MTNKLDIASMSNEDIEDLFTQAYEKTVAIPNGIGEFECKCQREATNSREARVEVLVVGMAGSPTLSDYKEMKLANSDVVVIEREGKTGSIAFKLNTKDMIALNSTDYIAVYETV
jgi:hypothetical protein